MNSANSSPPNVSNPECAFSGVAGVALLVNAITRRTPAALALAGFGCYLATRAVTGRCAMEFALGADSKEANLPSWARSVSARQSITVSRPRQEVYQFFRQFENLPRVMRHLERVEDEGDGYSQWTACGPLGKKIHWRAETTSEVMNSLLGWRSLPGSDIEQHGEIRFEDATGDRGCVVRVVLKYRAPGGLIGTALARLFGEEPNGQIADDLRRLRALLEAGEVPTIKGQPSDVVRQRKGYWGVKLGGTS